jgi:hypothetical protein
MMEGQISEIDENDFADARNLLIKASEVLANHFTPLNESLDKLEQDTLNARKISVAGNGAGPTKNSLDRKLNYQQISKILRDDYSALNLITMNNTLLHTTALALDCHDVATIALKHLENLAPLVIKMGELVPEVVTRELYSASPKIDLNIAKTALENTKLVWQKSILPK